MAIDLVPIDLIEKLSAELGSEHVVFDEQGVDLISRTCIPFRELPGISVFPTSVEQVQAVVRIAAEFDAPIWPVSTGKNWGYGEKSACYPGGITMVLERMTRIWQVDEALGYVVLEPGVTYKQLNDYLKKKHPSLWADVAGTT